MSKGATWFLIPMLSLMLVGCSGNDPGPLGGTWKMAGPIPLTVTFRYGETESLGMIDKVSYKKEGNDVLVTYKAGFAEGTTMRYTIINPNMVRTELGTLHRIK